ncbi:MAG: thioredoxin fold domain-containing protein [Gammaproteobacteria bacterium]|nr:thioredoxin fold domain-containing protein [Gammaproteobacteria bacterium]
MKLLTACFLIFYSCFTFAAESVAPRDPYHYFFNETWGDFSEELDNAKAANKKAILIFFEMDECPFCHWMKENVLNQPAVQTYFRQYFLNFPVDIEGDLEVKDFSGAEMTQKYFATKINRVRATPVFGVFDLEGKPIARFTGRTANVEEFMWFGEYVVEGHYKEMSFVKYKRLKKKKS